MRRALLALAVIFCGCGRANEASLRKAVEHRFRNYRESRDTVVVGACRLAALPPDARYEYFRRHPMADASEFLPAYGECPARFELDDGAGGRNRLELRVRMLWMDGGWQHFASERIVSAAP